MLSLASSLQPHHLQCACLSVSLQSCRTFVWPFRALVLARFGAQAAVTTRPQTTRLGQSAVRRPRASSHHHIITPGIGCEWLRVAAAHLVPAPAAACNLGGNPGLVGGGGGGGVTAPRGGRRVCRHDLLRRGVPAGEACAAQQPASQPASHTRDEETSAGWPPTGSLCVLITLCVTERVPTEMEPRERIGRFLRLALPRATLVTRRTDQCIRRSAGMAALTDLRPPCRAGHPRLRGRSWRWRGTGGVVFWPRGGRVPRLRLCLRCPPPIFFSLVF
eukprot:COSAG01_NODE_3789_length_5692_cov_82.776685_6_plen_275_part_00